MQFFANGCRALFELFEPGKEVLRKIFERRKERKVAVDWLRIVDFA